MIKEGVLLLNMGGPNHLSEVELFLKNMFNDPHILPIKSSLARSLLSKMIVKKRLETAKNIYRTIGGCSPITAFTFSLTQKLQAKDPERFYSYAMRYTPPYATLALEEMQQKGIEKIHLFSMYPQYSSATTFSSLSGVKSALKSLRYSPQIRVIDRYYNHPSYIQMCVHFIQETLGDRDCREFVLVFSAHSLPESFVKNGDPYQNECEMSFTLLKEELKARGLVFLDVILSYQSRLGPMKWIGPNTKDVLSSLRNRKVLVSPLGFSIDNSETIYEIDIEYRDLSQKLGITDFLCCPCPNDSLEFVQLILELIGE